MCSVAFMGTAYCDLQPVDKEGPSSDTGVSAMPPLTGRSCQSAAGRRGHGQDVGPFARGVINERLAGATPRKVFALRRLDSRFLSGLLKTRARKQGAVADAPNYSRA